jgi:hypothetical protein
MKEPIGSAALRDLLATSVFENPFHSPVKSCVIEFLDEGKIQFTATSDGFTITTTETDGRVSTETMIAEKRKRRGQ